MEKCKKTENKKSSHPNLISVYLHASWKHANVCNLFQVNFSYIWWISLCFFFCCCAQGSWGECRHHAIRWQTECAWTCYWFGWKKTNKEKYQILIIFHSRRLDGCFLCAFAFLENRNEANNIYKLADDVWSVINLNEIGWPNSSNRWQWFALFY